MLEADRRAGAAAAGTLGLALFSQGAKKVGGFGGAAKVVQALPDGPEVAGRIPVRPAGV